MNPDDRGRRFYHTCLDFKLAGKTAPPDFLRGADEAVPRLESNPDPENRYLVAADFAFCGVNDAALRLLKSSVEGKYCAYQAMQQDVVWAQLHDLPEFKQILSEAKRCRDNFLAETRASQ